jgi:transcriptional regulator with XRE-family HTH domain
MVTDRSQSARIGDFLKAHRLRLTPQDVGLNAGSRRRTPGLRREEVAQLAGISTVWYMRIEQGRNVAASVPALARIAQALRLTSAERAHLFALADRRDPAEPEKTADDDRLALLDELVAAVAVPAYVLDRHWDLRAWNGAAAHLFRDLLSSAAARRNMLRYVFLDRSARRFIVDWEARARRIAAESRADLSLRQDGATAALIADLRTGSPQFAQWWEEQHILDPEGGERRFDHPAEGALTYEQLSLLPAGAPGFRLVTLLRR